MEAQDSLPRSQEPATGPYVEQLIPVYTLTPRVFKILSVPLDVSREVSFLHVARISRLSHADAAVLSLWI